MSARAVGEAALAGLTHNLEIALLGPNQKIDIAIIVIPAELEFRDP